MSGMITYGITGDAIISGTKATGRIRDMRRMGSIKMYQRLCVMVERVIARWSEVGKHHRKSFENGCESYTKMR